MPVPVWADWAASILGHRRSRSRPSPRLFGLPIYGFQNYLTIEGTKGSYRLAVFWPNVGVQSIIIYSLVMIVVTAKLQAPLFRKLIYMVVGVCGTIFLNVLRRVTIAYYADAYATSGQQLDAFHNSIGEILFPIWIAICLIIVLQLGTCSLGERNPRKRGSKDYASREGRTAEESRIESENQAHQKKRVNPSESARRNAR